MPRVSRAETERNRIAIEKASSRLIRERGLAVSVADLMGAAGLTHGGFYGHFQSKDELTAIACADAFAEATVRWKERAGSSEDPERGRTALVEGYLSDRNRASPGESCAMAALAVDVSREAADKPVRQAFLQGLQELVGVLAAVQPDSAGADKREQALAQISTMVGALVLARATEGSPLSDELLDSARTALLERP